jgi:glutamine amidotransferase
MRQDIAIIKYNAGNIGSVANALQRMGIRARITDSHEELMKADKIIFPGVGEASTTMDFLRARGLDKLITGLKQPVLGICLGMQLMCAHSEEGDTPGLGIFKERVKLFRISHKVPHMGWNSIETGPDPLLKGLSDPAYFYFVHSYYCETGGETVSGCEYGVRFSAYLQKDNFYAVQFHPEKSGPLGAILLNNFIEL